MKQLDLKGIDDKYQPDIFLQDYSPEKGIDGVKIVDLPMNIGEDGYFAELFRLDRGGVVSHFPNFKLSQVNRTSMAAGTIKAWHLHLKQDEIWCAIPSSHILVGLHDLREDSKTKGVTMRAILGMGKTQLLYIPTRVAHGSANLSPQSFEMLYFVNQVFDKDNPDEYRLHWDLLGKDFWRPLRD